MSDPELFRQEARDHHARSDEHGDVLRVPGAVASRRRKIPFIAQLAIAECGAACLAMNLGYHGRHVGLEAVRDAIGPGRDGLSAFDLIRAATAFGHRGRGVKIDVDDLAHVDRGTILHWGFTHFVVFDRVRRDGVEILDPMIGRRRVPFDEVRKKFTGVALLFEPGEDFVTEARRGRGAWAYALALMAASRGLLISVLAVSLALQIFALAVPLLTGGIVDLVVPARDRALVPMLAIGLVGLVAFQLITSLARARLLIALRTRLDLKMTVGFLDHLIALPYPFFQVRSTGDLMQRWSSNTQIREILTSGTLSGAIDGVLVALYLVLLIAYSWSLGLIVVGLGVGQLGFYLLSRRKKRELLAREIAEEVRSQSYQIELLAGMETLKTLGAERGAAAHWGKLFVNVLNASVARSRYDALIDVMITTVRFASPLVVLLYGAAQVIAGDLSLGRMLALSALAAGFLNPLATLVGTLMQLQLLGNYLERLDDVFRAVPEQDPARATPAPRLTGQVSLEDIAFRFSPTAPLVVDGVTVAIEAGQRIGVVGRSGAGKSTLAAMLAGLYRPERGRVTYDGHDLADLELRSVRAQLGVVTQDPYLFAATIRANIAIARPDAPLEEVEAAARRAQIHDEIAQMPMGYDTLLIDRGATLSGGQRQRVALARALLAEPAILILDEATSALDSLTERSVQVALAELRCTRIVIAHRMATVIDADRILVLDGGALVAQGTHAELLAAGGLYAQLVAGMA